ncbi:hypothetical protein AG1IA_09521 [Rhizoctonia solani AG-1 IA]|uniref:Uncharacterized protein n=1 Tax=Thanatephorus cucumeris (strain AG1-IA) TaxID=983506 RepID=L8WER5_THACA|nr:hypothetical protein AG1IA_09521 [Rhizoctonia solani AG-1 IA]
MVKDGVDNLAESTYGTAAWDDYWSKLNGDGNITWGRDKLSLHTILGSQNLESLTRFHWCDTTLPDSFMSIDPLSTIANQAVLVAHVSRCFNSRYYIYWDSPHRIGEEGQGSTICDGVLGVHTCDKRRTKTYIRQTYKNFGIESGFTEEVSYLLSSAGFLAPLITTGSFNVKDELWTADHRETNDETDARLRRTLDAIFDRLLGPKDICMWLPNGLILGILPLVRLVISVTAHSGAISSALRVLGHRAYSLPTGGVIPVVIKATEN